MVAVSFVFSFSWTWLQATYYFTSLCPKAKALEISTYMEYPYGLKTAHIFSNPKNRLTQIWKINTFHWRNLHVYRETLSFSAHSDPFWHESYKQYETRRCRQYLTWLNTANQISAQKVTYVLLCIWQAFIANLSFYLHWDRLILYS